jgi:hypothetical protein
MFTRSTRTTRVAAGVGVAAAALAVGVGALQANASGSTAVAGATSVGAAPATASADGDPAGKVVQHPGLAWFYTRLTSDQRVCLADQGITRPAGPLTAEQRAALRDKVGAAAKACSITMPDDPTTPGVARAVGRWATLTPDQQKCLAQVSVTRPIGKLTDAQRAKVKADLQAAVTACGVTSPAAQG